MADYLLDTNIIIDYLRGNFPQTVFIENLVSGGGLLHACEITIAETYSGMREGERKMTDHFLNSLRYLSISRSTAQRGGELRRLYRSKGKQISLADALIAALCISQNLILVTLNLRDYPMPELQKISP